MIAGGLGCEPARKIRFNANIETALKTVDIAHIDAWNQSFSILYTITTMGPIKMTGTSAMVDHARAIPGSNPGTRRNLAVQIEQVTETRIITESISHNAKNAPIGALGSLSRTSRTFGKRKMPPMKTGRPVIMANRRTIRRIYLWSNTELIGPIPTGRDLERVAWWVIGM